VETLTIEPRGSVHILWLNRPDKRNAINRRMLEELDVALADLARSDECRVIVLAGKGSSFCAGFDIDRGAGGFAPAQDPVADASDLAWRMDRFLAIWDHPKPVVAAVHGNCIAAATLLCMFADLTIVERDARIGYSVIPLGGGYIDPVWVHLVGPKRAKQIFLVPGNSIDGATAADWGWANYAVDSGRAVDEALEIATRMSRMPADVLNMRKRAINRMVELSGFRDGIAEGAKTDALLHQSPSIRKLRGAIGEHGLKEAIRLFQAGKLEA
jgi:enoyl-CoA hydratase/carnithine racemase